MSTAEPRNPFYLLLLLASLIFVMTAFAYGLVPVLRDASPAENHAKQAPLAKAINAHAWKWLLYELGAMTILGLLSMGLDRYRSLKKEREMATIHQPSVQEWLASVQPAGGDTNAIDRATSPGPPSAD
jgi:hypothetical protein